MIPPPQKSNTKERSREMQLPVTRTVTFQKTNAFARVLVDLGFSHNKIAKFMQVETAQTITVLFGQSTFKKAV